LHDDRVTIAGRIHQFIGEINHLGGVEFKPFGHSYI
jgi:hypothetical protein